MDRFYRPLSVYLFLRKKILVGCLSCSQSTILVSNWSSPDRLTCPLVAFPADYGEEGGADFKRCRRKVLNLCGNLFMHSSLLSSWSSHEIIQDYRSDLLLVTYFLLPIEIVGNMIRWCSYLISLEKPSSAVSWVLVGFCVSVSMAGLCKRKTARFPVPRKSLSQENLFNSIQIETYPWFYSSKPGWSTWYHLFNWYFLMKHLNVIMFNLQKAS